MDEEFGYWWLGRLQQLCEAKNDYSAERNELGFGVYSREIARLRDVYCRVENALEAYKLMQVNNPQLTRKLIRYGFRLLHRGYERFV